MYYFKLFFILPYSALTGPPITNGMELKVKIFYK